VSGPARRLRPGRPRWSWPELAAGQFGLRSRTSLWEHLGLQRLYQVLPRAYTSDNCSPADSPDRQALATVGCKKTSDPGSPTYAAFSLYPNAAALDKAFQDGISEDAVTPCPHGGDSPGIWHTEGRQTFPLDRCSVERTTRGRTCCGRKIKTC